MVIGLGHSSEVGNGHSGPAFMVRVDTTQWPASGGGVQVLLVLVAVFALIVCLVFLIGRVVVCLRPGMFHMPGCVAHAREGVQWAVFCN